ncbi:hypothetical protein MLD38_016581 [Melastoma candidum]|uniref:Uncharacterized protein n=1 Tax=Melastoma candidum TaxID=119954 RepID=A0ACB9QMX1_9MYRT|nr:hypothetical protein MLD38_016581 [Melastoma candidum]
MASMLTEGGILKICQYEVGIDSDVKPVVQVYDMQDISPPNSGDGSADKLQRFRMMLSDGTHWQQGMLATHLNHFVDSGSLCPGSIVRLEKFICTYIKNRQIIICADLEVVRSSHDLIGQPEMLRLPASNTPKPCSPFQPPSGGGIDQGRYPPADPHSVYTKSDPAPPMSGQFSGSSTNQNAGYNDYLGEVTRPSMNNYGQQPQQTHQPPQQMYMNRGPIADNEAPPRIVPVAALNPYQKRWTIKARVTVKSEIRHYNNSRGDGKVFSFDLLDADGGEIRVTCFNTVVDRFFNQIETGKVYMISRGSLRPAQKNFNHLKNDHEMFLVTTSVVQPCIEDDDSIPKQQFHFQSISEVESMENNSVVDIIGVVYSVSPATSMMKNNGSETQKRSLHLKDDSGRGVELAIWGNFCNVEGQRLQNLCESGKFPVVAVKSARVNDFNGKLVSTISSSRFFVEPDILEARELRDWFLREGKDTPTISISREVTTGWKGDARKMISQIKYEKLGTSQKPDWIAVCATISYIKVDNFCYAACPLLIDDRKCNKKVTNNGDGKWRCDRCDRSVDECEYRYILQLQIQDHTGLTWVTAFQETGEEIMGMPAKDLFHLRNDPDSGNDRFRKVVRKVLFTKFVFKLKVKEETFGDEQRVKSTVVKADRVNFSSEARFLLHSIERFRMDSTTSDAKKDTFPSGSGVGDAPSSVAGGGYQSQSEHELQHGNQYGISSLPGMSRSLNIQPSCTNCGKSSHSSSSCPSIICSPGSASGGGFVNQYSSGNPRGGGGDDTCHKCHQTGHWAKDCPGRASVPPAY